MTSGPESIEHVQPQLGGELQRVDIDAFVVTVESVEELLERDSLAQQSRPV